MPFSDWFGFPGELEHKNQLATLALIGQLADSVKNLTEAVNNNHQHIEAIEKVLYAHNLAKPCKTS